MPGVVVVDGAGAAWNRFTVDARLKVLRAGEVFMEAGPFLRCQSLFGVPLRFLVCGLGDRR